MAAFAPFHGATEMWKRGNRLFSAASIGLIVVALLHTMGHFQPQPTEGEVGDLIAHMDSVKVPLGLGMAPSILDVQKALSLTMSILLLGAGALNLLIVSARAGDAGLILLVARFSTAVTAALVALYAYARIPPPMITLAAVGVVFLLASTLPRRA